jgi:hypothetical protein
MFPQADPPRERVGGVRRQGLRWEAAAHEEVGLEAMVGGEPLEPTLAEPQDAAVPDVSDDEDAAVFHYTGERRRHPLELRVRLGLRADVIVDVHDRALDPFAWVRQQWDTRVRQVAQERADGRLGRDAPRAPARHAVRHRQQPGRLLEAIVVFVRAPPADVRRTCNFQFQSRSFRRQVRPPP